MKRTKRKPTPPDAAVARRKAGELPAETRAAEVTTVAWMLTLLATLGAELASCVLGCVGAFPPLAGFFAGPLAILPDLLLAIAGLTGLLCLGLTAAVLQLRQVAPPRGIVAAALLAALAPFVAGALLWAWR